MYSKRNYLISYLEDLTLLFLKKNSKFYFYYIRYYILNFFFFFYSLELTISNYTNQNCFLLLIYNFKFHSFFTSAKILCEYITLSLRRKITIRKLFFLIKNKQSNEKSYKKRIYRNKENNFVKRYFLKYRYPLKGIRILYSGNLKKAKRKKKISYFVWLSNVKFLGRMPLRQFKFFIDYHKRSVYLRNASVGIKVWLLFNIYKKKKKKRVKLNLNV